MKILVTGGAGYIGSVTVKRLIEEGHDITVFDNLVYGHATSVSCTLIQGELTDKESLFEKLKFKQFDAVIHFAAYAYPGESMSNPHKYFYYNLVGGMNILEFMREQKIPYIVFSSSCAVFGNPKSLPIKEDDDKQPESVYGESKLMFEKMLFWYEKVFGIKHINLRYFNAAGATLDNTLGEDHDPESHLIPLAMRSASKSTPFTLFGDDYPTPDGTCVRDYIHVEDLAEAHSKALVYLSRVGKSDSFNLGTGKGCSNREVLSMIEKVSKKKILVQVHPRRPGDPPIVYADKSKAKLILGFNPLHSDLENIITTAWRWYSRNR